MFMTFSRGYPVSEAEVRDYFSRIMETALTVSIWRRLRRPNKPYMLASCTTLRDGSLYFQGGSLFVLLLMASMSESGVGFRKIVLEDRTLEEGEKHKVGAAVAVS
ncbi:hypothetical protein Scep_013701 [Stephania cephalantha]|uniref:Uncharacterized protein n=1 Tax=Stephania cephalantha TaxID=152367 RepID=A0AAP0P0Z6_9MAGN